jgi:hypothetical protein
LELLGSNRAVQDRTHFRPIGYERCSDGLPEQPAGSSRCLAPAFEVVDLVDRDDHLTFGQLRREVTRQAIDCLALDVDDLHLEVLFRL